MQQADKEPDDMETAGQQEARSLQIELLDTLVEISGKLLSTHNTDELLVLILQLLHRLVDFDSAAIHLKEKGQIQTRAAVGKAESTIGQPVFDPQEDYVWQYVEREKKPFVTGDVHAEPWSLHEDYSDVRSFLAVPLLQEGEHIGLLTIDHHEKNQYGPVDVELVRIFGNYAAIALQNAQLLSESGRYTWILEMLHSVRFDALQEASPSELASRTLDILVKTFGYELCSVYQVVDDTLQLVAEKNYPEPKALEQLRLTQGVMGRCVRTGQAQIVPDVRQDQDFVAVFDGVQSELCVPIFVEDRVYGVIDLESYQLDRFDTNDFRLVTILANKLGIALHNQVLYNETRNRLAIVSALHASSIDIVSGMDETELFETFVQRAKALMNAQAITLFLYDASQDALVAKAVTDNPVTGVGFAQSKDTGIMGAAFQTGKPVWTSDYRKSPYFDPAWPYEKWPLGAVVSAPLLVKGKPIGVLDIHKPANYLFQSEEIQTISLLANQIATVIENQRLFQTEQKRVRQLALLNEITSIGLKDIEFRELLDVLAKRMAQIADADACAITLWKDEQQMPHVVATYGTPKERYLGLDIHPDDDTVTKYVLETRSTLIVEDISTSPIVSPNVAKIYPVTSVIGLPLLVGGERIGAAIIGYKERHKVTDVEKNIVEQAAAQAGIVIAKTRLIEQERKQRAFAETMLEFSYKLMGMSDVATAADAFLKMARRVVNYDAGSVMLISADNPNLGYIAATHGYTNAEEALQQVIHIDKYPLLQKIRDKHTPVYLPDLSQTTEWIPGRRPDAGKVQSILLIPLVYGQQERVIGSATFKSYRPNAFSQPARRNIILLGNQTASAMRNLHLFEETNRRLREMSLLAEVSEKLNRTVELPEILQLVLDRMIDIVNQDGQEKLLRGAIILRRPPDDSLHMAIARNFEEKDIQSFNKRPFYTHEGTFKMSVLEGKWVELRGEEAVREAMADPFPTMDMTELLNIPLMAGDDVIGVITMNRVPKDENTRRLLGALADLAGAAIQKAQLLNQARSQARELMEIHEQLQEVDRLREEFIQSITHDLRAPLTFIRGYAELMLEGLLGELTDEQREAIEIIQDRTDTVAKLVTDILDAKQIDLQPLEEQPIYLENVAYRAVRGALMAAQKAGLDVVLDIETEQNCVLGDERRLGQVFDNLLSNAIKYSPNGGIIHVYIYRKGNRVVTSVADTGMGIPVEDLDNIWERYYRVKGSAEHVGGTGLGLANVRRIVEAHGGRVWVESSPEGTTFTFELPLHTLPPNSPKPKKAKTQDD